MRIDALLSRFGYCSRSEARAWLKAGRVRSKGVVVRNPADKAEPATVTIDDVHEQIRLSRPLLMQSPNGHWWSYTPDNTGALVGTDLGVNP